VCGVSHQRDIVLTHGTGLANVEENLTANEDTVYPVASCTKRFTTASWGILVDEGKLSWTDPVQFSLLDIQTSEDLETAKRPPLLNLCWHGTGLAPAHHLVCDPHDGFWVSGKQQVHTNSQSPVCCEFSSHRLYSNAISQVIGKIITQVSGKSSGDFLQERVFDRLGMTRSVTRPADQPTEGNYDRVYYVPDDGPSLPLSPSVLDDIDAQGVAGFVRSSVRNILTWAKVVMKTKVDNFH